MAAASSSTATNDVSRITKRIEEIVSALADNEDKQQTAVDLTPEDQLYQDILADCDDVDDPHEKVQTVLQYQLNALQDEEMNLVEEMEDLKKALSLLGYELDEDHHLEDITEVELCKNSKWKRSAEAELDSEDRACGVPLNTKRTRGASGFTGLDPMLNRTKEDLEEIYSTPRYEREAHVLNKVDTNELNELINEDIDEVHVYDDENDDNASIHGDDEPIQPVFVSGALYNTLGRVDPLLASHLLPHQREGIDFVANCFSNGHGAILALSMGMGKTLTVLTLIDTLQVQKPDMYTLVVAPATIAPNWEREYEQWTPSNVTFHPLIMSMHRNAVRSISNANNHGGIIVTTFDTFRAHVQEFGHPQMVVIDEGHRIKNEKTQLWAAVNQISTCYKLVLTGTPLQNNLNECYTLADWVSPGILVSPKHFKKCFMEAIQSDDKELSRRRIHMLHDVLQKIVFRRNALHTMLPTKTEFRVEVDCSHITINAPSLFGKYQEMLSLCLPIKCSVIGSFISTILADLKAQVVVFSGRTIVLQTLAALFPGPIMLGETTSDVRQEIIDNFQNGTEKVIYVATKTGAQGINLTSGTHVIIADASFNPTWEMQAVCRCWRMGQTKPVYVYRIIAGGTIEDQVYKQQIMKQEMFSRIVDDKDLETVFVDTETAVDIPKVDINALPSSCEAKTVFAKYFANYSSSGKINEITLHELEEMETDRTPVEREMAQNDYNIICSKHSRYLADEHGTRMEVKPNSQYVGSNLVPPFPPSVTVPANNCGCVIFGVCTPSYTTVQVEYRMRHSDDFKPLPAVNSLASVTPVPFSHIGEYCFRIRGYIDEKYSPWSDESAFVFMS